jgi:hypothetical protein
MPTENCRYGEIRSLYIGQLAHAVVEDSTMAMTRASIDKKVDSFAQGGLEHAAEVFSALWGIANKGGNIKPPTNASSTVSLASVLLRLSCGSAHHVVRKRKLQVLPTGLL